MTKRLIYMILSLIMIIGVINVPAWASNEITVQVNGQVLSFDVPPQIIEDRTMVSICDVFLSGGDEADFCNFTIQYQCV